MRLGDTNGIATDILVVSKDFTDSLQAFLASLGELHSSSAIDALTYLLYLTFYGFTLRIGEVDRQRLDALDGIHHFLSQFYCTITTFQESLVDSEAHATVLTVLADDIYLLVRIRVKTVQRHDDRLSEALHIVDMTIQVLQALPEPVGIGFLDMVKSHATVHLQSLCRSHDNHQLRLQASLTALDIKELLSTQVGTEACLRHHIVTKGHRHLCGHHTGTAMGDIRKRATMNKGRRLFGSLHQVGRKGITHQHGDSTTHTQVANAERLAIRGDTQEDVFYTTTQIVLAGCQTEDSHQLRSWCNVKTGL